MLIQNYNTPNPTFKGIGKLTTIEKVVNGVVKRRFILEAGEGHFKEADLQGANLLVIKGEKDKAPILEVPIAVKNLLYQSEIQHAGITCNSAHIEGVQEQNGTNVITALRNFIAIHSDLNSPIKVGRNCIFNDVSSVGEVEVLGDFYNKNESMPTNMTIHGNAFNIDTSKISSSVIKKDLINQDEAVAEGVEIEGSATNKDRAKMENCTIEKDFDNKDNAVAIDLDIQGNAINQNNAKITDSNIGQDLTNQDEAIVEGVNIDPFDSKGVNIKGNVINKDKAQIKSCTIEQNFENKDSAVAVDLNIQGNAVNQNSAKIMDSNIGQDLVNQDQAKIKKCIISRDFENKDNAVAMDLDIDGNAINQNSAKIMDSTIGKDFENKNDAIAKHITVQGNVVNRNKASIEQKSKIYGTLCNRDSAQMHDSNAYNMVENWQNAQIRGGSVLDLWNWSKVCDTKVTNNAWNNGTAEMCGGVVHGTLWAKDDSKALDVAAGRFESHGRAKLTNVTSKAFRLHDKTSIFGYLKGHIAHMDPTVTIDPKAKLYTDFGKSIDSKQKREKQSAKA